MKIVSKTGVFFVVAIAGAFFLGLSFRGAPGENKESPPTASHSGESRPPGPADEPKRAKTVVRQAPAAPAAANEERSAPPTPEAEVAGISAKIDALAGYHPSATEPRAPQVGELENVFRSSRILMRQGATRPLFEQLEQEMDLFSREAESLEGNAFVSRFGDLQKRLQDLHRRATASM